MAIDFARPTDTETITLELQPAQAMEEVKPYDIEADRAAMVAKLENSQEIEDLTAKIDITDLSTIVSFGSETAEEIAKVSDVVLRGMNMRQLDDSGKMLTALSKIMDKFKIEEFQNKTSMLDKIFGNVKKQLDRILEKYGTMGDEVDRIYIQLKQYESEIRESNRNLEDMFNANVQYFHELEKYIVAGEQGCKEIAAYMQQRTRDLERTGDQSITFELQSLQQALNMLEQRTQDLRTAETVALQSIPMLKMIEFSNMNLVRKINSAFIVTLPVFKQALAQAIMLKRQKLQADAMSELDRRTNEMLIRNARNTAEQSKITARLANGSSISADTLETSWRTIMNGIDETMKISEETRAQRERDQQKLESIKRDFNARYGKNTSRR